MEPQTLYQPEETVELASILDNSALSPIVANALSPIVANALLPPFTSANG